MSYPSLKITGAHRSRYTVARGAPNPLEDESKARVLVEKHSKRV
jgi:hypothetical protein